MLFSAMEPADIMQKANRCTSISLGCLGHSPELPLSTPHPNVTQFHAWKSCMATREDQLIFLIPILLGIFTRITTHLFQELFTALRFAHCSPNAPPSIPAFSLCTLSLSHLFPMYFLLFLSLLSPT